MAQESNTNTKTEVDSGGVAEAKNKCIHVSHSCRIPDDERLKELATFIKNPICCISNCDQTECWLCLRCHELFCSRYANKHMNIHYSQSVNEPHCLAMGLNDLSFWCFKCDSYINHLTIQKIFEIYELAHIAKHNQSIPPQLLEQTNFNNNNNNNKKNNNDSNDDQEMVEYDKNKNYNVNIDILDHSIGDHTHDERMKQISASDYKSCIEWNNDSNQPNLDPILSNLNRRRLFVGALQQKHKNKNSNNIFSPFSNFSARNGLTGYSLFDHISSLLKLEYIKLSIDNNIFLDRCIGSIYGMGIGDATGAPLEFLPCVSQRGQSFFNLHSKTKKWRNEKNAFGLKRGQWTDDASMGLCMADSLLLNGEYNGSDIRVRFWNWWNNGYNNAFRLDSSGGNSSSVGLGGNISKSIYSMKHGEKPTPIFETHSDKDDSGNGSLMRLAPIPVFLHACGSGTGGVDAQLMDLAMEYAKQSSFTTHPGYIAAEACALMSYIIIHAIHRQDNEYENNVKVFLEHVTGKYSKRIEVQHNELRHLLEKTLQSQEFNEIKEKVEKLSLQKKNKHQNNEDSECKQQDKYIKIAWSKIQINLNHIHRKIIALKYMMKLINSAESDDSRERCWNWRCVYGELGIDLTMKNRGSNYNGYPNTQGYFGSYCMDGLAMGLHSLYNSHSFGDSIMKAVNMLGDADSTGSIAGQLAGAWYGFKSVFYDMNKELFLFKQIAKWDDYEFGIRAILLYCIGNRFAEKAAKQIQAKKNNNTNNQQQKQQANQNEDDSNSTIVND